MHNTTLLLIENNKLRFVLVIPIGEPIKVANEAIETQPLIADQTSKVLST